MDQPLPADQDLSWIDKTKIYLVQVVLNRAVPAATASFISIIAGLWAAHQDGLESFGINYIAQWSPSWLTTHDISGPILLIELDTTSIKGLTLLTTAIIAGVTLLLHHTKAAVTGAPQSGGQRASDQ